MTINRRSRTLWKIKNTVRYLGAELDDALILTVQTDVELALAAVSAQRQANAANTTFTATSPPSPEMTASAGGFNHSLRQSNAPTKKPGVCRAFSLSLRSRCIADQDVIASFS